MNRFGLMTCAVCMMMLMTACTGKDKDSNSDAMAMEPEGTSLSGINSMNDFNLDGQVEVDGRRYDYEFAFECDKSLPVVTTADGYEYYDNQVRLIVSLGQQVIVERTFRKDAFRSLIPASDYQKSVLAGFNYNYMKSDAHDRFYFVAVVGDPDESGDINHTVGIAIDRNGEMSMSLIRNVDTDSREGTLSIDPDEDAA